MLSVVEYARENGSNPYRAWFDRLHAQAAAKVATAVTRLELGNTSRVKWIGTIGEYRIDWGPGYRIYFTRRGKAVLLLLCGGDKKSQKADIKAAQAMVEALDKAERAAAKHSG